MPPLLTASAAKRRRLQYGKCSQCRKDKKRCDPADRQWPQRCNRCAEKDYTCSENAYLSKSKRPSRTSHRSSEVPHYYSDVIQSDDGSDLVVGENRSDASAASSSTSSQRSSSIWPALPKPPNGNDYLPAVPICSNHPSKLQSQRPQPGFRTSGEVVSLSSETETPRAPQQRASQQSKGRPSGWADFVVTALNDEQAVSAAVKHGVDLNTQDCGGHTALHYAAQRGDDALLRSLVKSGANLEVADCWDCTPLHHAAREGQASTVQQLLDLGADVNKPGACEMTPLHEAAAEGHASIVELLALKNANVDKRDTGGTTPLASAVLAGSMRVVHKLIRLRANADAADKDGITPLMIAAQNGRLKILTKLLASGASVVAEDNEGKTALHHATVCREGEHWKSLTRMLVQVGASTDRRDCYGHDPLHYLRGHCIGNDINSLRALGREAKNRTRSDGGIQVPSTHRKLPERLVQAIEALDSSDTEDSETESYPDRCPIIVVDD